MNRLPPLTAVKHGQKRSPSSLEFQKSPLPPTTPLLSVSPCQILPSPSPKPAQAEHTDKENLTPASVTENLDDLMARIDEFLEYSSNVGLRNTFLEMLAGLLAAYANGVATIGDVAEGLLTMLALPPFAKMRDSLIYELQLVIPEVGTSLKNPSLPLCASSVDWASFYHAELSSQAEFLSSSHFLARCSFYKAVESFRSKEPEYLPLPRRLPLFVEPLALGHLLLETQYPTQIHARALSVVLVSLAAEKETLPAADRPGV